MWWWGGWVHTAVADDLAARQSDGVASGGSEPPVYSDAQHKLACTPGVGVDPAAYFITNFCLTLDEGGKIAPIPRWQYVLHYIRALEAGDDLHVEKTRQMMATWIACAYFVWVLLFRRGSAGFVASRKQDLVDDGGANSTPNSLMGRIRFIYDRLPTWAKELGPVQFSHLRVKADWNESYIIGESANPDMARGGTYSHALIDEAAFIPQSESCHRSVRLACARGLVLQGTPNGRGNAFARIRHDAKSGFRQVRLHWTDHPERWDRITVDDTGHATSDWYEHMRASMTSDQVARELDINYSASVAGLVFPEFDYDKHYRTDVAYDPDLDLHLGMDFGIGAPTAALIFQIHGNEVHGLDDYEMANAPASVNAKNLWAMIQRLGFQGRMDEVVCHGDPAGNAREIATGSSVIREYRAAGFSTFSTPRVKLRDGIRLVRNKFHRGEIYFSTACTVIAQRLPDYKYPTDDAGNVKGDEPSKTGADAIATHIADALRYGITGTFPVDGISTGILPEPPAIERKEPLPVGADTLKPPQPMQDWRPIASNKRQF